jgi:hypothetical protein
MSRKKLNKGCKCPVQGDIQTVEKRNQKDYKVE